MSLEFYSNPDLEDGFGATAGRTQPHRGLDFPKPGGAPIPAWAAGTVIISQYHAGLGWVVETDSGTVFPGYCHLVRQGVPVGTKVAVGDIIGFVGNTGSQSFGNHLHTTAGNRRGAVFGASMAYLQDPWPLIQAAQDQPVSTEEEGEEDMAMSVGHYIGGSASTPADMRHCVIYYPGSGFYTEWSGTPQAYINEQAQAHKTGNFSVITESHWRQTIKPQLDKLLAK